MSLLFHGDCLEEMKNLDDNSVDLIFCDLPYGQTSCEWDTKINLNDFWIQIMRIKKLNTPIFFTTTTKFGVDLITSAPKKCPFRYDLVWIKSSGAGFLSARKMPMRKHEMIYVFYEKLPLYDLSSHTHKFIKEGKKTEGDKGNECYGKFTYYNNGEKGYDPPLPVSVVKDGSVNENYKGLYGGLKEPEYVSNNIERNKLRRKYKKEGKGESAYDPPLPVSIVKEPEPEQINTLYGEVGRGKLDIPRNDRTSNYEPPLPTTTLEIKSTRGKHSTEKPIELMKWILKYYSKEGDVVLDPTMGSGSTGVSCKEMNRNFIGIEKDPEIYQIAVNRIEG